MVTTKKSMLSKLKHQLEKSKTQRPTLVETRDGPYDHDALWLMNNIHVMLQEGKSRQTINDHIKIFITQYPTFNIFHLLLSLKDDVLSDFVEAHRGSSIEDSVIIQKLKDLHKHISQTYSSNFIKTLKNSLPSPLTFHSLYDLNADIFEPLMFMDKYNEYLLPKLMDYLFEDMSIISESSLRKKVEYFIYRHRYDYVVSYLEREDTIDKQEFVISNIRNEAEDIRSKHLFLQITNLITEKVSSFQKPLNSILYRYLPEKRDIPKTKKYFEMILDIVINKVTEKSLEKYFSTKASLEYFKTKILPYLSTNYENVIRQRCVEEFDQSYIFKNAYRVHYTEYLQIIKNHLTNPIYSVDYMLYNQLKRNGQTKLDEIIDYLDRDKPVTKRELDILLERYIVTQPLNDQPTLRNMKTMTISQVRHMIWNVQSTVFVQTIQDIHILPEDTQERVLPKKIDYIKLDQDESEVLQRTRPHISNFHHVAITPVGNDNIDMYIERRDGESDKYYIPNDLFYKHLVDGHIQKGQNKKVFTLNKKQMTLANVTVTNEYIIQDEDVYYQLEAFINHQKTISTITHPIGYFDYFKKSPMLLFHNIQKFRNRICHNLSRYKFITCATKMESCIFDSSSNMGEYTNSISILLTLCSSEYTNTFRELVKRNRFQMQKFGELINGNNQDMYRLCYPESFENDILVKKFQQDVLLQERSLMLDGYSMQYPTRRIPYLPLSIRYFDLSKITTLGHDQEMPLELSERYLQEEDSYIVEELMPEVEDERKEEMEVNDPLSGFLDMAYEELGRL